MTDRQAISRVDLLDYLRDALKDARDPVDKNDWSEDRKQGFLAGARIVAYYLVSVTDRCGTAEEDAKSIEPEMHTP